MEHLPRLPQGAFAMIDAQEHEIFYEPPRRVYHINEGSVRGSDAILRNWFAKR